MVAIRKIHPRQRVIRMTMTSNRPTWTACRLKSIEYNHSLYDPVGTLHHHTVREHPPWLGYVPIMQPAFTTSLIVMIS